MSEELSVLDYAKLMNCSAQTINRMIQRGELNARKIKNSRNADKWLITVENAPTHEVESIPVSRPISPIELKELIIKSLARGIGAGNEELQEQIFDMQKQVDKQSALIDQQTKMIEQMQQMQLLLLQALKEK